MQVNLRSALTAKLLDWETRLGESLAAWNVDTDLWSRLLARDLITLRRDVRSELNRRDKEAHR